MAKRQPRSFTPPKKSDRRTTGEPEKKGREKAVAVVEVEEAPERPGMPFEDILVLVTAVGLVVGLFLGMAALGRYYAAGPMSGSYHAPTKGDVVDPGTIKLRIANVK